MVKDSITSEKNPRIKKILKLKERPTKYAPSAQNPEGEVLVEGPRVLEMVVRVNMKARFVMVTDEFLKDNRWTHLLEELTDREVSVFVISDNLMKEITDLEHSQGVIGVFHARAKGIKDLLNLEADSALILDRIQEPGNMGTIIRTAEAFGVKDIIIVKGSVNPFSPKVIRASAGGVFAADVYLVDENELIKWKDHSCFNWVALTTGGGEDIRSFIWEKRSALILGNEAHGISDTLLSRVDSRVGIPMIGKAESLNVAVSAGIALYEYARGRDGYPVKS